MKKLQILLAALLVTALAAFSAEAAEVALTSVGQSSDAMMIRVILKSLKIAPDYDAVMKPEALTNQKVLIAVVGGSSKGLGAAGINKEDEVKRADALIKAAKSKKMKIVMMHIGGEGRRGTLSDFFITSAVPNGDVLILVDGANKDGLFDKLTKAKKIPVKSAANVNGAKAPLKEVLDGYGVTK
ncbi:MAG: DUF6305 family protein [Cloacibacillus sp.]